jgi:hypothetical protein
MNSKEVSEHVQKYLYEHSNIYQACNYNKTGYQEADILAVTKALLVTEIEIKVSRSDFIADFKKSYKHIILSGRINTQFSKIPNRFYYACPSCLIYEQDIPEYAGLIWVSDNGSVEVKKKAPLLHKEKAGIKLMDGMLSNLTAKVIFGCQYMTYKNKLSKERYNNSKAA